METVNKKFFADMCKVSRAAIGKACEVGKIKTVGTGRKQVINLNHKLTQDYLKSKTEVNSPPEKKKKSEIKKPDPLEITAPKVGDDEPADVLIGDLDDINRNNIALISKTDMDKIAKYETALSTRVKREELRGELIRRSAVRLVFSKLYSIYVNQFKTMEDRLTPEICGIFKFADGSPEAVRLREILSGDNAKTLNSVHRLFNDFLRGIKAEKI